MKVRRLPRDPGPAAWSAILAQQAPPTPLEESASAEWLVIGAGFAGLAAARRLAQIQPSDRIVILDAVRVGEGPAGRNSGFMIDLPHDLASDNYSGGVEKDHRQIAANRQAIDFAVEAALEYALPSEAIRRCGKINGAASTRGMQHNADYSRHLDALGEPHEGYDARTMREITGSDYYLGGVFTPGAAMVQPAMFVRGIATGLRSKRVTIHENSPVISLDRDRETWIARTPRAAVKAPRVILAVNGHAESFGYFRNRLMHVFTYASMTRALTGDEVGRLRGAPAWGLTPADPLGTTVRRISGAGGDRLIVRNRFTYDPSMEITDSKLQRMTAEQRQSFDARFPKLADVGFEYRWGGRLCLSRNNVPAFGEVDEGLFTACCQNGLGVAQGTFSGIAVAELAADQTTKNTRYQLSSPGPSRLPPVPIARVGAAMRIRWGERHAGEEL